LIAVAPRPGPVVFVFLRSAARSRSVVNRFVTVPPGTGAVVVLVIAPASGAWSVIGVAVIPVAA
jgi:hypothetical protein